MQAGYPSLMITAGEAEKIAHQSYGIHGTATALKGELDFNFKIDDDSGTYLLKVTRPDVKESFLRYQNLLIEHLNRNDRLDAQRVIPDSSGRKISVYKDPAGNPRLVRMLTWVEGRTLSTVNPVTGEILSCIGKQAGKLTSALMGFDHELTHRYFEWDIPQASWTREHLGLFSGEKKDTATYFLDRFAGEKEWHDRLRKGVVHNDVNDHNVILTTGFNESPECTIIDYGDAIYTQLINDVAVTIAYSVMNMPDPLEAAKRIVSGYNQQCPLKEEELEVLYTLVGIRLVISVTRSELNKREEPENNYLQISQEAAWKLLAAWKEINPAMARFTFREACGFPPHPREKEFQRWATSDKLSLQDIFPGVSGGCFRIDLGMESVVAGHRTTFDDPEVFGFNLSRLQDRHKGLIPAGGYLETRPIYTTDEYRKEGNCGPEYRSVHLGIDFWLPALTAVHAPYDGEVVTARNDKGYKEYGGLIVLQHREGDLIFYTLYGHQSVNSVSKWKRGDTVKKGQFLSELGVYEENGNWAPHLHFQIILDLMGMGEDFPGVCYPAQKRFWASVCPDPNLLFKEKVLENKDTDNISELLQYRRKHLGRNLSLSYRTPLHIVRGDGVFLFDHSGRKYLDTVNNVAHVGHEHPRVISALGSQQALLNTNTRYLNRKILEFTRELLATFPDELSVVYLVNSGSEANELALRMARTYTGRQDMIAVEMGYHGNTDGCISVSSYKFEGKGGSGRPEYTQVVPLPDTYRGIYEGPGRGPEYASHVSKSIRRVKEKGRNVAGFICESIISCGGQIELPDEYLSTAVEQVRSAGGVYIADEVQTGCGRLGEHFWGFQMHRVVPDIVTIGKPIGNGHPLGAVVCRSGIADAFANGMEYFNTFGGNPVSCAAGLEVLKIIEDEHLVDHAHRTGAYLKKSIQQLQDDFPIIGDVRGTGLFLGVELCGPGKKPLTTETAYLINRMKDYGILMSSDGREENVLKIKPPMVFNRSHADELTDRLRQVLAEDFMKTHL